MEDIQQVLEKARQIYVTGTVFIFAHLSHKEDSLTDTSYHCEITDDHYLDIYRDLIMLYDKSNKSIVSCYGSQCYSAIIYVEKENKFAPIIKQGINIELIEARKIIYKD